MRRSSVALVGVGLLVVSLLAYGGRGVEGASSYADQQFKQQWDQGEAITPNFWGPLSTAKDGTQEPYAEASGGQRLVQYFDKGRMELTNGAVTNGLLASEIVKGQVQVGNAAFQPKSPPAIPIAGDNDNPGPTYAHLSAATSLTQAATPQQGGTSIATMSADGTVTPMNVTVSGRAVLAAFDLGTQHNVPGTFAIYRETAGLATIGFAITEPFGASVKVAGQQRTVMVQVFERRVLTFTPDNPPAFQVEMGNIGQHYYQWRYTGAPVGPAATATTAGTATTATRPSSSAVVPSVVTLPLHTAPPPPFPTAVHKPLSPPSDLPPLNDPAIIQPPSNLTCATFHSQAAAQAYLRAFPNDPSKLDPNRTGIACPNNPGPFDRDPVPRT